MDKLDRIDEKIVDLNFESMMVMTGNEYKKIIKEIKK